MDLLSTEEPAEEKKPKPAKKVAEAAEEVNAEPAIPSYKTLVEEIKVNLKKGSNPNQLKSFLQSLSGTPQEVMNALLEALFEGAEKGFAKDVAKKKNYLAAMVQEDISQVLLLRAIETFCANASPSTVKETALALKTLYDADILEEEFIVKWYEQGLAGEGKNLPMWKNIKPFIEWIQSAESEAEEE